MKAFRQAVPLVALALALTACGDEPLTIEGLAGEYTLVAAAGSGLPATVESSDTLVIQVTGGRLSLISNGQYTLTADFQLTDPGAPGDTSTQTFIDVGPWEITGDFVLLASTTPGKTWVGTVDGSEITVELSEPDFLQNRLTLTYRR